MTWLSANWVGFVFPAVCVLFGYSMGYITRGNQERARYEALVHALPDMIARAMFKAAKQLKGPE